MKGLGSISFLDQTDGIIRSLPLIVSFDKKTIFGTRAQMDFNNPNSFIGATALFFNQSLINEKVTVFGNLPYNISTEILCKWIPHFMVY